MRINERITKNPLAPGGQASGAQWGRRFPAHAPGRHHPGGGND